VGAGPLRVPLSGASLARACPERDVGTAVREHERCTRCRRRHLEYLALGFRCNRSSTGGSEGPGVRPVADWEGSTGEGGRPNIDSELGGGFGVLRWRLRTVGCPWLAMLPPVVSIAMMLTKSTGCESAVVGGVMR